MPCAAQHLERVRQQLRDRVIGTRQVIDLEPHEDRQSARLGGGQELDVLLEVRAAFLVPHAIGCRDELGRASVMPARPSDRGDLGEAMAVLGDRDLLDASSPRLLTRGRQLVVGGQRCSAPMGPEVRVEVDHRADFAAAVRLRDRPPP